MKFSWLSFILIVGVLVVLWKGDYLAMLAGEGGFWDLSVYHQIVTQVRSGTSPYQVSVMQTLGPPSVLIPFVPFSLLPLTWATRLFTLLSLGSAALACWWLARRFHPENLGRWWLVYVLALLSAFPTRLSFITGQLTVLALVPIVVVLFAKSDWLKAAALSVLVLTKTFFIGVLLGVFSPKQWRLCLGVALFSLALLALFLPLITPAHYLEYLRHRAPSVLFQPDAIRDLGYYSQSVKTTFSRLGFLNHSIVLWFIVTFVSGLVTWRSKRLTTALVWSILVSPVVWQHYLIMIFPLIVMTGEWLWRQPPHRLRSVWILAVCLWWVEFPWLHQQSITWWWGVLASHYAVSGWLVWLITLYFPEKAEESVQVTYTTLR